MDADPNSGMALYFTASWNIEYNPLGGTSLSSPLFGAAVTEIDQVKNGRTGLNAGSLYATLAAQRVRFGRRRLLSRHHARQQRIFYAAPGLAIS